MNGLGIFEEVSLNEQFHSMRMNISGDCKEGDLVDIVYIKDWNASSVSSRVFRKVRVILSTNLNTINGEHCGCVSGWLSTKKSGYDNEFSISHHSVVSIEKVQKTLFD